MITRQPVEWSLSSDSVGSIVEVDQGDKSLWRTLWARPPAKRSGQYAIGLTSTITQLLPRGTIGTNDDVWLLRGQTWVSVTSASEGASHVTAVAPSVAGWNERRQSATIHWVDGQWGFPPPSISSYGGGQTLVTRVTRATSNAPIEGWIVRYEIGGGTPAALDTSGAQASEVRTNNNGEAAITVIPQGEFAGVTTVNIQVIRTGSTPGDLARLPVGQGSTTVTWVDQGTTGTPLPPPTDTPPTGPAPPPTVTVQMTGPSTAEVGAIATYRIRLDNLGTQPVSNLTVVSQVPMEYEYESSIPPAEDQSGRLRWQMGPLDPAQPRQITLNYRVRDSGSIRVCAAAEVGGALPPEDCVTTIVPSGPGVPGPGIPPGPAPGPANLGLRIDGPANATVGAQLDYQLYVTNPTNRTVRVTELLTNFDDGLEHVAGRAPIRTREFGSLGPGENRFWPLTFTARSAGQHCFEVQVTDDGGGQSTDRHCVTVGAQSGPPLPSNTGLVVQKTGPSSARVGDLIEFNVVITNLSGTNLTNLSVVDELDIALEPKFATQVDRREANRLLWNLQYLPVGQSIPLKIQCLCLAPSERVCTRIIVSAGGLTAADEVCLRIEENGFDAPGPSEGPGVRGQERPEIFTPSEPQPGLSPPGSNDPLDLRSALNVRVRTGIPDGRPTQDYFLEVSNDSDVERTNVIVTTLLPRGASLSKAIGPPGIARSSIDGGELEFNPIRSLRANERVSIQLVVHTGGAALGAVRARVTADPT